VEKVKWILPVIVVSQFCCTSLWFAGNGVMNDLASSFHLNRNALGHLTSAVQFGFIAGTLVFAVLTIADRFLPSRIFFISAMVGALVVGTAFPHLIKGFSGELLWRLVLILTSSIAAVGGLLMLIFVPDKTSLELGLAEMTLTRKLLLSPVQRIKKSASIILDISLKCQYH